MMKRVLLPVWIGVVMLSPKLVGQDLMAPDPADPAATPAQQTTSEIEPPEPPLPADLPGAVEEPGDPGALVDPLPDLPPLEDTGRLSVPPLGDPTATASPGEDEGPKFSWRDHMRLRQIRTQFEATPAMVELRRSADTAAYDSVKRLQLKDYYSRLFAHVRKTDSSLDPLVTAIETPLMKKLTQELIDPSYPPGQSAPDPMPLPSPVAAPSPIPAGAKPAPSAN